MKTRSRGHQWNEQTFSHHDVQSERHARLALFQKDSLDDDKLSGSQQLKIDIKNWNHILGKSGLGIDTDKRKNKFDAPPDLRECALLQEV